MRRERTGEALINVDRPVMTEIEYCLNPHGPEAYKEKLSKNIVY